MSKMGDYFIELQQHLEECKVIGCEKCKKFEETTK